MATRREALLKQIALAEKRIVKAHASIARLNQQLADADRNALKPPSTHRLPRLALVRMNNAGLQQLPKHAGWIGTVLSHHKIPGIVTVSWDQRKTPSQYTEDYLELVSSYPAEATND